MKALIPVAGAGVRLRPHTYTQPKPLIPIAGKAIISFTIEQLVRVGITEFIFVIGYLGEKVKDYVSKVHPDIQKEFVHQVNREGLGHAVWTARDALKDSDEVIIVLGDTIFDVDLQPFLHEPHSCLGVRKVDNPREFGVAEIDEDGFVKRVVEKPKIPMSNFALVGLYKCREVPLLLDVLDYNIQQNVRTLGEFQLTDGIMCMIEQGVTFKSMTVNNWFDCGKKEGLLETNSILLKKNGFAPVNLPFHENTIIIHPVHIGNGCRIQNSIVGPNVTVGEHANINCSIVRDSIIGSYASIDEVVLSHSLIGSDASVNGLSQRLNIGDNTEIDLR